MRNELCFEEFVYKCEWDDVIRISQFISEFELRKMAIKKVREHKRGRSLFAGPYGDRSEWAGMCRNWYRQANQ